MSDERVTIPEACALLNVTDEQLRVWMCGPDNPELGEHLNTRQLLAARIAMELVPLTGLGMAVTTGVTAGQGAKLGGKRLLVVALPDGQQPKAFWREADAGFRVKCPFIGVPADDWFDALADLVREHRRAADRPN